MWYILEYNSTSSRAIYPNMIACICIFFLSFDIPSTIILRCAVWWGKLQRKTVHSTTRQCISSRSVVLPLSPTTYVPREYTRPVCHGAIIHYCWCCWCCRCQSRHMGVGWWRKILLPRVPVIPNSTPNKPSPRWYYSQTMRKPQHTTYLPVFFLFLRSSLQQARSHAYPKTQRQALPYSKTICRGKTKQTTYLQVLPQTASDSFVYYNKQ